MAELAAIGSAVASGASALGGTLGGLGTLLSIGGTIYGGIEAHKAGKKKAEATRQAGEFEAQQLERSAAEERAKATRAAQDRRARLRQVVGRQTALAASSGAGTEGASIVDLFEDTIAEGNYLAKMDVAAGENRAAGRIDQAKASRYNANAQADLYKREGQAKLIGAAFDAGSTALRGLGSYTSRYSDDDLLYADYDPRSGFSTRARRSRYG